MRGLVVVLIAVIGILSFSLVVASIGNINNKKIEAKEQTKEFEFSAFTSAVCENREKDVYCKDELFVNCNGKVSKAIDVAECNGIKMDVPKSTGFAVFGNDWKDPRN